MLRREREIANSPTPASPDTPGEGRHARLIKMAVTVGSSVFSNLVTVVATASLVRQLGAEEFGRAAFLSTSASALSALTAAGVALYVIRSISIATDDEASVRSRTLDINAAIVCAQLLALLVGFLLVLYGLIGQSSLPPSGFVVAALALPLITADALAKNQLIGHQRIAALAIATVAGALLLAGLQLAGAYLMGLRGYLIGFLLGSLAQFFSSHLTCRHVLRKTGPLVPLADLWGRLSSPSFRRFVIPATLASSMVPLAHWAANFIAATKAARYSDVATITVAMQFFSMVVFIPTVLNKIALPRTIRDYQRNDSAGNKSHTRIQVVKTFCLASPALPLVWLLERPIAELYRFDDMHALYTVYFFVAAGVLASTSIAVSNYIVSTGRMSHGLFINVCWTCVYLGLALLLPGGALAVGQGLTAAYAASLGLALYVLARQKN